MTGGELRFTRRMALRAGALGAAALAAGTLPGQAEAGADADVGQDAPLGLGSYALNTDWLFGGVYASGAEQPGASESGYSAVTLPHTVTSLSWSGWTTSSWEQVWIYRKHFSGAALSGGRVFLDFQGVMTTATVYFNGQLIATHQGGYLPFSVELTPYLAAGDNVLALTVDGRLQYVPPDDPPGGDAGIDYLQPAGIYRDAALRIVPEVFVSDVFAKPTDVLSAPGLDALVTVDAGALPSGPVTLTAAVLDGPTVLGQASAQLTLAATGPTQQTVSVSGLAGISLWSPESPQLYDVEVTLNVPSAPAVSYTTRTGFREAVFQADGFHLNGARYQIFGLNRHQLFPYTGMAAPERVQRRDAELLRTELNCNMVRCSHYPQSDWFLDACDELGLMVWEEPPGWQYIDQDPATGPGYQAIILQNVRDMVIRDRSRPSVIVWAVRLNETSSQAFEGLYAQTDAIAAQYDGTRQTTGAMSTRSTVDWNQQVFADDDYTAGPDSNVTTDSQNPDIDHTAQLSPPVGGGIPYMVSEAIGALVGAPRYRWIDGSPTLTLQAKLHTEVHSQAGAGGYAGLLGWCGIDYASLQGGNRNWRNLKTPGVLDTFRAAKPGAAIYRTQLPAGAAPVIVPGFVWDFSATNPNGPGATALVFTNCHSLTVTAGGTPIDPVSQASQYPHLAYPPFGLDLSGVSGSGDPELVISGLDASGDQVTELRMSSDASKDTLSLTADDAQIDADGIDATRVTVRAVDFYGNQRPTPSGQVSFALDGTGATLLADNPFVFAGNGGVGGGFLRSTGVVGTVTLTASHVTLGAAQVTVRAVAPGAVAAGSAGAGGSRSLNPEQVLLAPTASSPSVSPPVPAPTAPTPAPAHVTLSASSAAIRGLLRRMLLPTGSDSHLARILRDGCTLSFQAPSAGRLVVGWYVEAELRAHTGSHRAARRRVLVATSTVRVRRAGRARVRLHLTALGRTLLRGRRRASLTAEASLTPQGRGRVSETRQIELRH